MEGNGSEFGTNVVLTGFMGTGKTTVGRLLADRLDYGFVDSDDMIESRHGPIEAIFAEEGESAFRELERSVACELAAGSELVIATGGGLMLDERARVALEATGTVFCLVADVDDIISRVGQDPAERPLLDHPDPAARIEALLEKRAEIYSRYRRIDTRRRSPDEVAALIADAVTADRDPFV